MVNHCRMRKLATIVVLAIALAFAPGIAGAQVSMSVNPTGGTVNDTFTLSVTVGGHRASELGIPTFAETTDFAIRRSGTSTQQQIVNGKRSFSISFNFTVYPNQSLKPGEYQLPEGTIRIGDEEVALGRPTLRIVTSAAAGMLNSRQPVRVTQSTDLAEAYIGQQVTYRVKIVSNDLFLGGELEDVELKGFLEESFGKQGQRSSIAGSSRITTLTKVLIPTKTGTVFIPSRVLSAKVKAPGTSRTRRSLFDSFPIGPLGRTGRSVIKRYSATPLELEVKPLPPAPDGYYDYIPTGRLSLRTDLDSDKITEGESVTLTLTLTGTGNLRPFDLPDPLKESPAFKRYDDRPKFSATVKGDKIFYRKVFKIAFVPKRAGELELPQFRIAYFDPRSKKYQFVTSDLKTIEVTPNDDERLLIRSGEQTQGVSTDPDKQAIEVVGEGLLPQHEGRYLFEKKRTIPRSLLLLILVLVPSCSLALAYFRSRQLLLASDPLRRAQLLARKNALSKLEDAEELSAEQLYATVTRYIGDRFRVRGDSLTAVEAKELIATNTALADVAEDVQKLLNQLQGQIYSGQGAKKVVAQSLIDEAKNSIERIEKGSSV